MARRPLVAANWKMNGLAASIGVLDTIVAGARTLPADIMVCPPATLLARFAAAAQGSSVLIGGQNCHAEPKGAFTGEISAEMIKDAGAASVIVGHSERRHYYGETDAMVRQKTLAAWRAGLIAMVCVGETQAEHDAGRTQDIIGTQLEGSLPDGPTDNLVIAYEPVWSIGTGVTPTVNDVGHVHGFIRRRLADRYGDLAERIRVLYGGSVKAANAKELMGVANVDGALVGGASLDAGEFLAIAGVYR